MQQAAERARMMREYHRLEALIKAFEKQRGKDKYKIAVVGITRIKESMQAIGRTMTARGWKY